jgi:DNA-binding transcriptional LysR family regulator
MIVAGLQMSKLPDLEGLAMFAKVAEERSYAGAARSTGVSVATLSRAVSRLEDRLGGRLFNRSSRQLALTEFGRELADRAAHIYAEAEDIENIALESGRGPRGLVRLAAPMSFGVLHVAPLLPEFLASHSNVSVDLHLSDGMVDIIGGGFDAAIRITVLPDSSLVARRLSWMPRYLVGAPEYLNRNGRPQHPRDLEIHRCIEYTYRTAVATRIPAEMWHFKNNNTGETATVRPSGQQLRVNNGDAMMPALIAGTGLAVMPEFIAGDALTTGRLEQVLPEWSVPSDAVHWVTPPGGPRPTRVEVLGRFLAEKLSLTKPHGRSLR